MDLYVLVYLLSNVFLAHIINKFMYLFYEKCRVNKYIEFCIYSAYFVLITFVLLNFSSPVITISFNILSIFLFTLMYDYVSFKKSMVVTFITYLILFSVEVTVLVLTNFNKYDLYTPYKYKNIIGFISMYVIIYIVFYLLIHIKNFKKIYLIFLSKYFLFFLIVPIISIILIIVRFLINADIYSNVDIYSMVVFNLSILFLNIFIFKYCDFVLSSIYEKKFNKILNRRLSSYKRELFIFEKKFNFKKYVNSSNYIIDGILNSKISHVDNEVKLNFNILVNEDLRINLDDLLIILGNLIDNAVSGVRSTLKNKDKYIDIKIKYTKGTIIFNIKNSFNQDTLNKNNNLFNKKREFKNYGLGLLTVKEIVGKYKGVLEVKSNKNNFETYVLIYI